MRTARNRRAGDGLIGPTNLCVVGLLLTAGSCRGASTLEPHATVARDAAAHIQVASINPDVHPLRLPVSLVKASLIALTKDTRPAELATAMSGRLEEGSRPSLLKILVADPGISVNVEMQPNGMINEIGLWFRSKDVVRFEELLPILGPYDKVVESKTSAVKFRGPAPGVSAYAHLLSSKVLPGAVVSGVELRSAPESAGGAAVR